VSEKKPNLGILIKKTCRAYFWKGFGVGGLLIGVLIILIVMFLNLKL